MTSILCNEFNKGSFSVPKIDKESKYNNGGAYLTFPNYLYSNGKDTNFVFKTLEVKLTQYG
ncbi:unnamed protein product, partial [marine sediment metagenome]